MIENIEITWTTLLALFGAIAIIGNGVNIIKSWINPAKNMHKRVSTMEKELKHELCKIDDVDASVKILYKCVGTLLDNNLTGVSHDKLLETRDALNQYLIDR